MTDTLLHVAGPMRNGIQLCKRCPRVLADETRYDPKQVPPGSTRYDRNCRVAVMTFGDCEIQAPMPYGKRLPIDATPCNHHLTEEGSTP